MNALLWLVNAWSLRSLGILALAISMTALGTPAPAATSLPPTAPAFTLADAAGQPHALAGFRGRPVALFFFCGCSWCRRCAQVWGQFQRGGALAPAANGPAPRTVVVFSGDAGEARAFATQTGLDRAQTTLLLDPMLRVTQGLYHAEPCPRVFVLDGRQKIRYTNSHADDAARTAPALAIASRALTALRQADVKPATASRRQ